MNGPEHILDYPEETPVAGTMLRRVERAAIAVFLIAYFLRIFHLRFLDLLVPVSLIIASVCYFPLGTFLFNKISLRQTLQGKIGLSKEQNISELIQGGIAGLNIAVLATGVLSYTMGWRTYQLLMVTGLSCCSLLLLIAFFLKWKTGKPIYSEIIQRFIYWLFLGGILFMR